MKIIFFFIVGIPKTHTLFIAIGWFFSVFFLGYTYYLYILTCVKEYKFSFATRYIHYYLRISKNKKICKKKTTRTIRKKRQKFFFKYFNMCFIHVKIFSMRKIYINLHDIGGFRYNGYCCNWYTKKKSYKTISLSYLQKIVKTLIFFFCSFISCFSFLFELDKHEPLRKSSA